MKSVLRGMALALVGTVVLSGDVWAHPGHITLGGLRDSVVHILSSPYHVSVVAGVVVLAVAWLLVSRPGRAVPTARRGEDEG